MENASNITEIAIVVMVALTGGLVLARLKQPPILGYVLAGVLLGPSGMELVQSRESVTTLADLGILLLLFGLGMELNLRIFKKVWIYVIIGVSLGGIFHGFAPEGILEKYTNNIFGVPIATLIGIPLYSNVLGMIPIIESLVAKGLPIGTALAFLMAVTALSLPEIIILKKVLKKKLIIAFIVITGLAILFTGYLFNLII